jgi:hypothetical protein
MEEIEMTEIAEKALHSVQKLIRSRARELVLVGIARDIPHQGRRWWINRDGLLITRKNGLSDCQALAWLQRVKAEQGN